MRRRIFLRTIAATALVLTPVVAAASPAVASHATPVVAQVHVPRNDFYDLTGGLGAVWLINSDEFNYSTLRRIDPQTNHVTATHRLDSSAGGIAIGFGSIWVSMYYDNEVERIGPRGHVITRIKVGLQPQFVHLAFGSVWTSNHHGRSVSRINPHTNRVIATLPAGDQRQFRNGPQALADDGRYLYVYSSNGNRPFERIDPRTDRVTKYRAAINCSDLVAIGGSVWSANCNNAPTLHQLAPTSGRTRHTITLPNVPLTPSLAAHRGALWAAFDTSFDDQTGVASGGTLDKINPSSGVVEQQLSVGGDASAVRAAAGDLWVIDDTNGVVTRLHVQ
jgi:streptogramin lyase